MLDFAAIENALLSWLVTVTGIPASNVVLDLQQIPQLGMPYVTLRIPEPQQVNGPDELRFSDTVNPVGGDEVTTTVYAQREFTISIKAFTKNATGASTAKQFLSQVQTSLALPKVRDAFNAAGLAFIAVELFADLSSREGPIGQGRAVMDVRLRTADTVTQTDTNIATFTAPATFTT